MLFLKSLVRKKLFILLVEIIFVLPLLPYVSFAYSAPTAEKGVLNIEQWDLEKGGNIKLQGEWEFYWNKLLTPDDFSALATTSNALRVSADKPA